MIQTNAAEKRPKRQQAKTTPRPADDDHEGTAKIFSVRLDPDLRAALELAAEHSGRSIGRELQIRLRHSVTEEEKLADQFGSYREALIWRAVAALMRASRDPRNPDAEWLDDPNAFDLAVSSMYAYLQSIRPKRTAKHLSSVSRKDSVGATLMGRRFAAAIWRADPSLPLTDAGMQAVANLMKLRIPEIVDRVADDPFPFGAPRAAKSSPNKSRKLKGA
jgi:TraY domain